MTTCEVREFDALDSASVAEVLVAAFAPLRTIYTPKPEAVDRQEQHVDTLRIIAEMSGRIVGTVEVDRHRHNLHLVGDWCVSHRFERLHEVAMAKIVR